MKILALDVATKCGWATETASGMWDFKIKKDESSGMRLIRFRSKLKELLSLEGINLITFESPAVYSKHPNFVQLEMHGVLKIFCDDNNIQYRAFAPTEVKQFATGNGRAGKPAMIAAAKEKLAYTGNDDNEADALWIYQITKTYYN